MRGKLVPPQRGRLVVPIRVGDKSDASIGAGMHGLGDAQRGGIDEGAPALLTAARAKLGATTLRGAM